MSEDATKNDPESVLLDECKEVSFDGGRDSEKLSKLAKLPLHEFVVQRNQMILLFQSTEPLGDNKTEAMLVFIDTSTWQLAGISELPSNMVEVDLKKSSDNRVRWNEKKSPFLNK